MFVCFKYHTRLSKIVQISYKICVPHCNIGLWTFKDLELSWDLHEIPGQTCLNTALQNTGLFLNNEISE